MKSFLTFSFRARRLKLLAALLAFVAVAGFAQLVSAAPWSELEPFKSRRADVLRVLGQPVKSEPGENAAALQFNVAGGTVKVAFVDAKFVEAKKLSPELVGTIKEIVLRHDHSSITPESLDLAHKSDFKREDMHTEMGGAVFRNLKRGLVYTFIGGRLKTTYYTASTDQFARAQKKNAGK
ncbi:MAG: hypothetical protein ACR2LC_09135 [Pyrinomonadaceae bacterium]